MEVIEKALRNRPGRFDRIVEIGEMDDSCCRQMLSKLLARAGLKTAGLDHLVTATAKFTGAQIEELANTIFILALEHPDQHNGDDSQVPGRCP